MCLENNEGEYTLPLEDITAIILESPQITLSSAFLSHCQSLGVTIVTCDRSHIPNGTLIPFLQHSRQSGVARLQQSWTGPLRKRLWQGVVQTKIWNQAACLNLVGKKEAARQLHTLAERVKSGDPDNVKAQAARTYWPLLLGANFRRGREDIDNAALNYGYAVARAFVARSQVAYGLIPAFGIHHNNELNAFNLTDDILEVFRPLVDREVLFLKQEGLLKGEEKTLCSSIRQKLANIGNVLCHIRGQAHTLINASDKMAAGLVAAIEAKDAGLLPMPELVAALPQVGRE